MGITLAKLAANTASVTFMATIEDEDGNQSEEEVTVKYYPGRVTEKTIASLQGMAMSDETTILAGFASFNEALCSLIKSWDVWDNPEQTVMFPIDPVRFAELPINFRVQVVNAIVGGIHPEAQAAQNGRAPH